MDQTIETEVPIMRRPIYKYGMLVLIVALLGWSVWDVARAPSTEGHAIRPLILPLMLLMNHLMVSFVPTHRQLAMAIPQYLAMGAGMLYIMRIL